MAGDRRAEYLKKWFSKAEAEQDVFDKFMSGWLAVAIAAQRLRTVSGSYNHDDTDRTRVIDYLKHHAVQVKAAIQSHRPEAEALARRRGSKGGVVIDGGNLQSYCRTFRDRVLGRAACSAEKLSEAMGKILNKVRNSLFHGAKSYDDTEDRALLDLVTPLMLTIIGTSEGLR